MKAVQWIMLFSCLAVSGATAYGNAAARRWEVVPHGHLGLQVMRDADILLEINSRILGPDDAEPRLGGLPEVADGRRVYERRVAFEVGPHWNREKVGEPVEFRYEVSAPAPDSLEIRYRARAETDAELRGMGFVVPASDLFAGGRAEVRGADGATEEFPLPLTGRGVLGERVERLRLTAPGGEAVTFRFDQPAHAEHQRGRIEVWVRRGGLEAERAVERRVRVRFDQPVAFEPQNRLVDMSDWYPVDVENDHGPGSALGMEDWLHRPAGKHGRLGMDGDRFVFEDGTPQKFWGINICVGIVAPPQEAADLWADRCAKYGANIVRMHKFWSHAVGFGHYGRGISDEQDSLEFDEEAAQRWDYFNAALAERGVYTGWSPYYAFRLTPADRDRIWAYDEIMAADIGPGWYHRSTVGLVNFAPDLQELHIRAMQNKLNRVNTVTGRRYAEEPSLAYIEIQNEDCIFFGNVPQLVEACPTYGRYLDGEFSDWLLERYGSRAALQEAWGEELRAEENFEERNIETFRGYYTRPETRRTIDAHRFLFEQQDAYYQRMVRAIRETGYEGLIVGSNWFTATPLGFYYNMASDHRIGFIDRHQYAHTQPMLKRPGTGLLNAGRLVVADRPFGLTEWGGRSAAGSGDGTALVGVYGMGLQDWDFSGQFASNTPLIEQLHYGVPRVGHCDRIINIAQYPALARMIYRGDVEPGETVLVRRFSLAGLEEGVIGFEDDWAANRTAFAAGRVRLEITDEPADEPLTSAFAPYVDKESRLVRSTTGQLEWDHSGRGFFTVDTPGTQAVIGFGGGQTHRLSDVTVQQQSDYALLYLSARERKGSLSDSDAILVHAVGRALNEGTVLDDQQGRSPIVAGDGPLRMEPVKATITLGRDEPFRVYALDHDGRLPQEPVELPVKREGGGGSFAIDGTKYGTMYYLVEFTVP